MILSPQKKFVGFLFADVERSLGVPGCVLAVQHSRVSKVHK